MIRVGVNVPNFGVEARADTARGWFSRAEAEGFDLAMVSDHVAVSEDVQRSYPAPFLEAFTLLAWAGARTERIGLGTTVAVLPYRHPLLVAEMVESIERLTGRNVVLGVGTGWAAEEFAALGVDHARRGAITDDALAALSAARTGHDHHGPSTSFANIRSGVFRGPIWVGGNSDRAVDRAHRHGHTWHPLDITPARLDQVTTADGDRPAPDLAPRIKLRVSSTTVTRPGRVLGEGTWKQIESDLAAVVAAGATSVVLDPDVPDVRAGADPWPRLLRAEHHLRVLSSALTLGATTDP